MLYSSHFVRDNQQIKPMAIQWKSSCASVPLAQLLFHCTLAQLLFHCMATVLKANWKFLTCKCQWGVGPCTHTHTHMHTRTCACMRTHTHTHTCACMRTHTHTHSHVHMNTHTHTHLWKQQVLLSDLLSGGRYGNGSSVPLAPFAQKPPFPA